MATYTQPLYGSYELVPAANGIINVSHRDVIGNKEDAAAVGVVSTTESLMAYIKQLVSESGKRVIEKSDGAVLSGLDPLFTITGGLIRAKIVGHVTTIIGGAANLRLQHITTDPAATVDLNAGAVAINTDVIGTIYHNLGATSVFTPSGGLGFVLLDPVTKEEVEFILAPGVVQCLGSAAQTGVIKWYMTYEPLSPNSVVTVAA